MRRRLRYEVGTLPPKLPPHSTSRNKVQTKPVCSSIRFALGKILIASFECLDVTLPGVCGSSFDRQGEPVCHHSILDKSISMLAETRPKLDAIRTRRSASYCWLISVDEVAAGMKRH